VSKTTRLGAVLGSIHLIAYTLSLYFADGGWQRAAIFLLWQIVDLPLSVIIYLSAFPHYWGLVHRIFDDARVWMALLPLIIVNGLLGTIWWFMFPRFGVWLEEYYSN
jgi:hypothetical protein